MIGRSFAPHWTNTTLDCGAASGASASPPVAVVSTIADVPG
jgi:hypothetical protein